LSYPGNRILVTLPNKHVSFTDLVVYFDYVKEVEEDENILKEGEKMNEETV
jgi:hypothetical protein